MPDSSLRSARFLAIVATSFVIAWLGSWAVLRHAVPFSYVSRGVVEIGYFNPRDYLPHPVISTRGLAAMVSDPAFSDRLTSMVAGLPPGALSFRAAPLEEGLIRVEARSVDPADARRGAVLACSLLVAQGNEAFQRERNLADRQIEMIRVRSADAESLIRARSTPDDAKATAMRALAHFTEIQVETEISAELMTQKKPTKVLVEPSLAVAERPSLAIVALGPAAVVALVVAVGMVTRRRRREHPA
ncbi:hypothetical protein JXA88_02330 [Candidatus Fermentibacteria bacterium]|nr:hypothetical protein [Candidatus Fermentibacteria bacterium]